MEIKIKPRFHELWGKAFVGACKGLRVRGDDDYPTGG